MVQFIKATQHDTRQNTNIASTLQLAMISNLQQQEMRGQEIDK